MSVELLYYYRMDNKPEMIVFCSLSNMSCNLLVV